MAQTSTETLTTKNKNRKNYLSYPYDYFTGSNARIFFNQVWVDDIVTIQYSMQQNKAPIFGYSSQQFDVVAKGQIMINGNFTIAFKEAGYLNIIYNTIKGLKTDNKGKNKKDILNYWLSKGEPIEKIVDKLYMAGADQDFEDLSEALEDFVWGNFGVRGNKITRPDEFDYKTGNLGEGIDAKGTFDIVMTFGDYTDDAAEHTVKILNDVHFTGESAVLTPDGTPVGINYTFFARGIDEQIPNAYNVPDSKTENVSTDTDLGKQLDAQYPSTFIVTVLEAWDSNANKINLPSAEYGTDLFEWLGNSSARLSILPLLKNININDQSELATGRTTIKNSIQGILNSINWETFKGGLYGGSGYNLQILKLDIKLVLGAGNKPESTDNVADSIKNDENLGV